MIATIETTKGPVEINTDQITKVVTRENGNVYILMPGTPPTEVTAQAYADFKKNIAPKQPTRQQIENERVIGNIQRGVAVFRCDDCLTPETIDLVIVNNYRITNIPGTSSLMILK